MNEEQRSFIRLVDNGSPDKVMVKDTGREGIDLAPHSHDCIQLVETVAGYGPVITKDDSGLFGFCLSFFHTFRKEERQLVLPLRGIDATLHPTLRKAMAFLHRHLADNVKVEDAAHEAGVSPRTLSRLFSEAGTTFSDYLGYQRIIRSLELMADNTMPIKEIAYDTGFSSPANFNRAFKQVMGMPPSEMRRKQGIS